MSRRRSQSAKRAVVLATAALVIGVGALIGLSVAVGRGNVDVANLGDKDFWVGNADRLAEEIDDRGPFLVPDGSPNRERDLYIQHLGTSNGRGWIAILAGRRECTIQWTGAGFQDPCSGATYPPDGAGLTRYRTRVEGNAVYVDLRSTIE